MVAEGARRDGHRVIGVGIRGLADPKLAQSVDEFHWSGVVRLGHWIRILRGSGCQRAILAGSVQKTDLFSHQGLRRWLLFRPDWTTIKLVYWKASNLQTDTILTAVADEFAAHGIVLEPCVEYTRDCLAPEGCMTRRRPSLGQQRDMAFGWQVARELGRFDIGQSVAVKDGDVIAVEGIEGTDQMIERAGKLCSGGGWCHVKVSKPGQDMRFDVPTVGPQTIEKLHRSGASALCMEAGRTLLVDREDMVARAERYGIVVVGTRDPAKMTKPAD
jgi:DUF1009 family protein